MKIFFVGIAKLFFSPFAVVFRPARRSFLRTELRGAGNPPLFLSFSFSFGQTLAFARIL